LNVKLNGGFSPQKNTFTFISAASDKLGEGKARAPQKVTEIKCVAVYNGKNISGEEQVINNAIVNDLKIVSSDRIGEGES